MKEKALGEFSEGGVDCEKVESDVTLPSWKFHSTFGCNKCKIYVKVNYVERKILLFLETFLIKLMTFASFSLPLL